MGRILAYFIASFGRGKLLSLGSIMLLRLEVQKAKTSDIMLRSRISWTPPPEMSPNTVAAGVWCFRCEPLLLASSRLLACLLSPLLPAVALILSSKQVQCAACSLRHTCRLAGALVVCHLVAQKLNPVVASQTSQHSVTQHTHKSRRQNWLLGRWLPVLCAALGDEEEDPLADTSSRAKSGLQMSVRLAKVQVHSGALARSLESHRLR